MIKIPINLLFFFMMLSCTSSSIFVTPVTNFELYKYLGLWYEIARLDNSFEKGMSDVTANYILKNNNFIEVINKGFNTMDNKFHEISGKAVFAKEKDIGHLRVSFWGPWYSDYVIFNLDPDYKYAFVSGAGRKYLWLLARTPEVDQSIISKFKQQATALGFNLDKLIIVDQTKNILQQ